MVTASGDSNNELPPRGIAVLGGSFNPPHRTHVTLARQALARLPIHELRAIPSGDHPHKGQREMAAAAHRLEMARLAFAEVPGVVVDDRELKRSGRSFTVDTLQEIAKEAPGTPLFFLIGSDNLPLLPTWHEHHRLLEVATVVTFPRAGFVVAPQDLVGLDLSQEERDTLLKHRLEMPADDVSATDIRTRWRKGDRKFPELPSAVAAYMEAHDLYR
jgi:nicotinate-nucleotide adenylyltransferase